MFELDVAGIEAWVRESMESWLPAAGLAASLWLGLALVGGVLGLLRGLRSTRSRA